MPRYRLDIAYDGTDFAGWWRQPGTRTVAGVFDAAFARLGEPDAAVVGAARTDAGVHALGQVAHVDTSRAWDADELADRLTRHLPDDCSCRQAIAVSDDWHAVHASTGKTYSYLIDASRRRLPREHRRSWHPPGQLRADRLAEIAPLFIGRHDLRAFSRRGDHRQDTVVTIRHFAWSIDGDRWIASITADRFLYRLVRSLIGTCIAYASGATDRPAIEQALAGNNSQAADFQAPARGLCLDLVQYGSSSPA